MSRELAEQYLIQAKFWLGEATKDPDNLFNQEYLELAKTSALMTIAEVLMDDKEDPKQDKKLKTEYKDPLWKDEDKDDSKKTNDERK